jgi:LAS superfamily LD-carboxypeptidase LdcB
LSPDPQQPRTRREIHRPESGPTHAPTTSATAPSGLTRRELRRLALEAAGPPEHVVGSVPVAAAHAGRHPIAKGVTVLALSATLALSGFSLHGAQTADASDALLAAQLTDRSVRAAFLARLDRAQSARLTAQADAFALSRQTDALVAAQAAVDTTETVLATAGPVVGPEALAELTSAMGELEELMAQVRRPVGLATPPVGAQLELEATTPEDLARAEAADRASRGAGAGRAPLDPPAGGAEPESADPAEPGAGLASSDTGRAAEDALGDAGSAITGSAVTGTAARPADEPADILAVSAEISEKATQVTVLADEVRAAADDTLAAAQAEALAEAAAQAAAAELARKVEVAKNAGNGDIPLSVLCAPAFAPDELLRCDAAAALERLNAAYRADTGHDLRVVSSYRSYGAQVATRRSRGWLAAVPGTSNHGLAVAVDFGDIGGLGNFRTAKYLWLKANAGDFGWFHPRLMERGGGGPQEPWHWEFGADED